LLNLTIEAGSELLLAVVDALGSIGSKQAVPRLLELLSTRDEALASEAILALGRIGDPAAVQPVLEKLRSTQNLAVQKCAVEALGRMGDDTAVEAMVELLRLGKEGLKLPLVCALGSLRSSAGLSALEDLATDADVQIRRHAGVGGQVLE